MIRTASRLDASASGSDQADALADLETEHRLVEALFARANLGQEPERSLIAAEIAAALRAHAELEETVVYPAVGEVLAGAPWLIDTSIAEHDEMRLLLAALEDATDELSVMAALRALQIAVQAHVAVEEGEIFPAFRQMAGPDAVAALNREADKVRSQSRPEEPRGDER